MKIVRNIILLILFAALSWAADFLWRSEADFTGKVIRVIDGDTLEISQGKHSLVRIRLMGVDCPEWDQPFGTKAKQFTADLAYGKAAMVKKHGNDDYGRTLGEIILEDGRNVNQELVRSGMAWWYRKYAPRDRKLQRLEAAARKEKIGLWSGGSPVAPWQWRDRR